MKKTTFIIVVLIFISFLFTSCQKAKETEGKKEVSEEQKIEAGKKFLEKFEKRLIEEAEKRGLKDVAKELKKREEAEREWKEKQEKEIKKILGETGKIIEDKYLEGLFVPEFPYESIKSVEKKNDKRYILIKANSKIKQEQKNQYIFQTLLNRGVSVHRQLFSHGGGVYDFMITIIRKTETPGVIEYSENLIYTPEDYKNRYRVKGGLREALRFKDEWIIIEVAPEFGHKFKRKVIYPEKEVEGPEPQDIEGMPENITRYPNSKRIRVTDKESKQPRIIYVTKDSIEKVIDFFLQKKKEYYDKNPHMRTRSGYTKKEEEYYLRMSPVHPYAIFGIKDIGGGVSHFPITDLKRDRSVVINLYQSGNANLKEYVEIHISR